MRQSSLTGESDVVHKSKEQPFIVSGTQVVEGEGRMLVLAVGPRTEWGRLIALTTGEMDNTPLQDKLAQVAALVAKIGLSVAVACFIVLFIFLCVEVRLAASPCPIFPPKPLPFPFLSIFSYCILVACFCCALFLYLTIIIPPPPLSSVSACKAAQRELICGGREACGLVGGLDSCQAP